MKRPAAVLAVAVAFTLGVAAPALTADEVYLGVYLVDEAIASRGAYVEDVAPDSPAAKAGVKAGDLVTAWGGEAIASSHVLIERLAKARPGDSVKLRIVRDEWEKDVLLTLARRPDAKGPSTSEKPASEKPAATEKDAIQALRAYLDAKDEATKARAAAALDALAFAVPKEAAARAKLLRAAMAPPVRAGSARFTEQFGDPATTNLVGTPAGYDASKLYPSVLSLSAYCTDARWSLRIFALPDEEWADLKKEDPDLAKDGATKPAPTVPWRDGLVLAPELKMTGSNAESFADARTRILDAIARANRSFAADPDRLVAAGMSMGGEIGYDVVSRHPDRFAGFACISGGMTQIPTPLPNLRTTKIFIMHGADDTDVSPDVARENADKLEQLKVAHQLTILEKQGHAWPTDPKACAKIGDWLVAQKRDAWPRELDLIFAAYPDSKDPKRRIYWIEVPEQNRNRRVTAKVADNVVTLGELLGFEKVILHLGEPLVDLDREVVVNLGDRELFRGKLARSWRALAEDLETDGWDTTRAAPVRLELDLRPGKK